MKTLGKTATQKINEGKRMTKSELAYEIHFAEHYNAIGMYYNHFTRNEIVEEFNKLFNTDVK